MNELKFQPPVEHSRSQSILFGHDILSGVFSDKIEWSSYSKVLIVSDDIVAPLWGETVQSLIPIPSAFAVVQHGRH